MNKFILACALLCSLQVMGTTSNTEKVLTVSAYVVKRKSSSSELLPYNDSNPKKSIRAAERRYAKKGHLTPRERKEIVNARKRAHTL